MPSISAPELGNGFYVPGSAGFYQGQKNVPSSTAKQESTNKNGDSLNSNNPAEQINSSVTQSVENTTTVEKIRGTQAQNSIANTKTLQNQKNILNSIDSNSAVLSASDLFSMNSLGLLQNFSNLITNANSSISVGSPATANSANEILLKKILSELEQLKASVTNQNGQTLPPNTQNISQTLSQNAVNRNSSSILRFLIDSNDMLPFCKTVFFSKPQSDGTFLLTGDCKYSVNGKIQTETFHLLFRATGTKNSSTIYSVTSELFQNQKNTNSALYKLNETKEFEAVKTGNLVSLRSVKKVAGTGANVDLLLNLGE
ncbi:hypothetical protein [Treponema pectinovorum]|uniref:hypothetical protein n=1 Tax=Treponema pectinovorum TaxID=164 RepID=UPI0011CC9A47|nr:hypothetical protein [Treponema pectinovorum]